MCVCVHARARACAGACVRACARASGRRDIASRASFSLAFFSFSVLRVSTISFGSLGRNLLKMVVTAVKVMKNCKPFQFCSHAASMSLPAHEARASHRPEARRTRAQAAGATAREYLAGPWLPHARGPADTACGARTAPATVSARSPALPQRSPSALDCPSSAPPAFAKRSSSSLQRSFRALPPRWARTLAPAPAPTGGRSARMARAVPFGAQPGTAAEGAGAHPWSCSPAMTSASTPAIAPVRLRGRTVLLVPPHSACSKRRELNVTNPTEMELTKQFRELARSSPRR